MTALNTPLPWAIVSTDPKAHVMVANVEQLEDATYFRVYGPNREKDAPLIVAALNEYASLRSQNARQAACVAACEGIPSYQLCSNEGAPVLLGEMIDSLRSRADAVPMLVDALDAAEAVLDRNVTYVGHVAELRFTTHSHAMQSISVARSLIATARKAIAQATPLLAKNPSGLPSDTPSDNDVRATDSQN
jgi:hypothetical protein